MYLSFSEVDVMYFQWTELSWEAAVFACLRKIFVFFHRSIWWNSNCRTQRFICHKKLPKSSRVPCWQTAWFSLPLVNKGVMASEGKASKFKTFIYVSKTPLMPSSALFNLLGHSSFGAFTFGRLSYHPKWFIFNVLIIVYAQIKRCDVILFSKMCFNNDFNIF